MRDHGSVGSFSESYVSRRMKIMPLGLNRSLLFGNNVQSLARDGPFIGSHPFTYNPIIERSDPISDVNITPAVADAACL